jgi:hypothetical protein
MKGILVSEAVWNAIAALGKFGETEDDVLRRVFKLPVCPAAEAALMQPPQVGLRKAARSSGPRSSFATDKMSSYISGNELRVSFASGASSAWRLPSKSDKAALRTVRDQATAFARKHGATLGQVNAVKKTLTDSGYHLLK